jgi:RNA polymerase sigma-70 factor (ECF subfamily)
MAKKDDEFRQIVNDNQQRIMNICRYYAANADDLNDIYQEVLINVWKSFNSFRGEAAISTWIYRIAVNTALGFTGKEFRRLKFYSSLDASNLHHLTDDEGSAIETKEIQLEALRMAVNQLSVIDNALISLTLEGLSSREIADIIGITEPNVRVKIHRIKQDLYSMLKSNITENE